LNISYNEIKISEKKSPIEKYKSISVAEILEKTEACYLNELTLSAKIPNKS